MEIRPAHRREAEWMRPCKGTRKEASGRFGRAAAGRGPENLRVMAELRCGPRRDDASRKYGVTARRLLEWRVAFLSAGEEGHNIRRAYPANRQPAIRGG